MKPKRIAKPLIIELARTAMVYASANTDEPPIAFRLFVKGWNRTSKGNFLFDDAAARSVMAAYKQAGVEMMIDLEHLSLDSESKSFDPDARGWFNLELRADGSLWAVNVRWTDDGAARLRTKKQRYISPAFEVSVKTNRILCIYNVAICAVPATYETPALVAASARAHKRICAAALEVSMEPIEKIAEALGLSEGATLEDILAAVAALNAAAQADSEDTETTEESRDAEDSGADVETSDEIDPDDLKTLKPKLQAKVLALSAQVPALAKRLAAIETTSRTSRVSQLIAANADKFTPKTEAWARKQTVENLEEFLRGAPSLKVKTHKEPQREGGAGTGGETEGEINMDAVRAVAKATGKSVAKIIEAHKKDQARQKEKRELNNG